VRRLQLAQFALLVLMAVVVSALVLSSARTLLDATARQRDENRFLGELMALRDEGRLLQIEFWRDQLDGGAAISPALERRIRRLGDRSQALADRQRRDMYAGEGAELGARRSIASYRAILTGARALLTVRDPALRQRIVRASVSVTQQVSREHDGWVRARVRAANAASRDLDETVEELTLRAIIGVGMLSTAGVLLWVMLSRARNRVVAHVEMAGREQAALRTIAELVAQEAPDHELFPALARQVVALTGGEAGWVLRVDGDGALIAGVAGSETLCARLPEGARAPLAAGGVVSRAIASGGPARVVSGGVLPEPLDGVFARAGIRAGAATPITVSGRSWGAVVVVARDGGRLPPGVEDRLEPFARLAGLAIANSDARRRLAERAASDSLTGLPNHGAFHRRLREEAALAVRHGRPLSLAVIDLDHFKDVNDTHGHQAGDRVLAEVAARLRSVARDGELVARVGGEEFAWLMPSTDIEGAVAAAERARAAIGGRPVTAAHGISASVGVCELADAGTAGELFRLADAALLAAKAQGRDMTVRHVPGDPALEAQADRAQHAERARTLAALRALARAVDARDAATQRHSERVADLTYRIALGCGWAEDRALALREAALVHDVGKIGIPDAVLRKPGALTPDEYAQVTAHAELGAAIVAEVLSDEQVAWVRHHHERIDGAGYPSGISDAAIPEGARILATADAWDAMTADRPYRSALSRSEALAECTRVAGTQLDPGAVAVIERLVTAGADDLDAWPVGTGADAPY